MLKVRLGIGVTVRVQNGGGGDGRALVGLDMGARVEVEEVPLAVLQVPVKELLRAHLRRHEPYTALLLRLLELDLKRIACVVILVVAVAVVVVDGLFVRHEGDDGHQRECRVEVCLDEAHPR